MKKITLFFAITFFTLQSCQSTDNSLTKKEIQGKFKLSEIKVLDGPESERENLAKVMRFYEQTIVIEINDEKVKFSTPAFPIMPVQSSPYKIKNGEIVLSNWKLENSNEKGITINIPFSKIDNKLKIQGKVPFKLRGGEFQESTMERTISAFLVNFN